MQATATTRRFQLERITKAALAAGMLASLAVGTWVATIVDGEDSIARPASVDRPTRLAEYRFADLNMMPGDSSAATVPSLSDYRFMEMNILPEAQPAVASPRSLDDYRFLEKNVYLGGDAQALPPTGARGERY